MSSVEIIPVGTASQKRAFLRLPERLYAGNPNWVCPLRIERRDFFDPKKNPYFDDAEVQLFLARKSGHWVGRISAHTYPAHNRAHKERTGFFGFFECENDFDVAKALWDATASWNKERGMDRMRGPANFTTNHEVGFLTDAFNQPPTIMMTYNPPFYPEFADRYGLTKAMDLYAYWTDSDEETPERLERLLKLIRTRSGATIRTLDMSRFEDEVAAIQRVYRRAWALNWGFVPMTEAEIAHMARDLKPVIDPRIVLLAERDGEIIGFSLALPDINQILMRLKGRLFPFGLFRLLWHLKVRRTIDRSRLLVMGVVPEFRKRGIDHLMHYEIRARAREAGYVGGELSWVLENNTMMIAVTESLGLTPYKTYRMYDLLLI